MFQRAAATPYQIDQPEQEPRHHEGDQHINFIALEILQKQAKRLAEEITRIAE